MTDRLLEWMSFRGSGKSGDLPPELVQGLSPHQAVHNLILLGHIELEGSKSWRVAPPVLAGLPVPQSGMGPAAVLCGARTQAVMDRLAAVCARAGIRLTITAIPEGPALIQVDAISKAALASAAFDAGFAFQNEAAFTLLACTPTIQHWPRTPCPMVAGRVDTVLRFAVWPKIEWVRTTLAEATEAETGFFRIKRDWDWVSILKTGVSDCAFIDDRAGRMAAAAKRRVLSWDERARTLGLPGLLYPPNLIARALALCTGTLPRFDAESRRILFSGITPEVLRLTLAITGLRNA